MSRLGTASGRTTISRPIRIYRLLRALPGGRLKGGDLAAVAHRHLERSLVGTLLSAVRQGRQRGDGAVAVAQSLEDEVVREPRVLGENGAMQVGAVDLAVARALAAVLAVVAAASDDLTQQLGLGAEVCTAAMVLEADQRLGTTRREVALGGQMVHEADVTALS